MNAIFCHAADEEAIWLYHRMKSRDASLRLVNADALSYSLRWNYRLATRRSALDLLLCDRTKLDIYKLHGVVNRVCRLDLTLWERRADKTDYTYVLQEMHAFFTSWLYGLQEHGICLNPPGGSGLSGNFLPAPRWLMLAHEAGLPVVDCSAHSGMQPALLLSGADQKYVLVVKDRITGDALPEALKQPCLRLARMSGNPLLEIVFSTGRRGAPWQFRKANPAPAFRRYGEAAVAAVQESFSC
jgi:hypothetical protein